jgi:hypothetical protein
MGLPTVMRQCSIAASFVKAKAGALAPIRQLNATIARAFARRGAPRQTRILEALPDCIFKTSTTGRKILSKDCLRQQVRARSVVKSEGCIVFVIRAERTRLPFGILMPLVGAVALRKAARKGNTVGCPVGVEIPRTGFTKLNPIWDRSLMCIQKCELLGANATNSDILRGQLRSVRNCCIHKVSKNTEETPWLLPSP